MTPSEKKAREIAGDFFGVGWPEYKILRDLIAPALSEAERRGFERAKDLASRTVDGETCSGKCECYSCEMLNKIAADVRKLTHDEA